MTEQDITKVRVIDKKALEQIYNSMILMNDGVKKITKRVSQIQKNLSICAENQGQMTSWLQSIEDRFAVMFKYLNGDMDKQDFNDYIEESGMFDEEDEEDDDEEAEEADIEEDEEL